MLQLYQRKPQQGQTLSEQQRLFQQVEQQFEAMRGHMKPLDIQRHKNAVLQEVERQLKHLGKWHDDEAAANPLQIRYYHCNQIGTPLALSDEQGNIVWAGQYDPWGNLQDEYNADPENIRQDIRMPGQHHDRVTGLYYNRHRYYDPQLGAYINQDPIGLAGGVNISSYAESPLSTIDPLGLANSGAAPKMAKKIYQSAEWQQEKIDRCAKDECIEKCIQDHYSDVWSYVESLSPFSLQSIFTNDLMGELERQLRNQAIGNSYGTTRSQYDAGRRQFKMLGMLKGLNSSVSVLGARAAGFQLGGYMYCSFECS